MSYLFILLKTGDGLIEKSQVVKCVIVRAC